jgi:hypothetical protein
VLLHKKERIKALEKEIVELTKSRDNLKIENFDLKLVNKELKQVNELKQDKIAHRLSCREETMDLKFLKDKQNIENKCAEDIRKVKDEYQVKVEEGLTKRNGELREMYSEVLRRLPDVNVKLK